MAAIYEVPSIDKIKLGITTSVLFDMAEPDAVWKAEQNGDAPRDSYRKYMQSKMDDPLSPHPDHYPIIQECVASGIYEFVILSRNSALTGIRAIRTLAQDKIIPEQFAFTNGGSIAEYCLLYGLDMFFTTNADDANAAHALGAASAVYNHHDDGNDFDLNKILKDLGAVLPLYTKPKLISTSDHEKPETSSTEPARPKSSLKSVANPINFTFDFDKVLSGPESDDYFAAIGFDIEKYHQYELKHMDTEMRKGPWYANYEKMMGKLRSSHRANIVTARGGASALRKFVTMAKWGVEPNGEIHTLSGVDKTPFLLELKKRYGTQIFLDDGYKNVERARKAGIAAGLVPSGNPSVYLGS